MYPFDQEKLASLLESAQIDLALVNSRHNLRYLTNYYFHFHQNFTRIDLSQYLPLLGIAGPQLCGVLLRRHLLRDGPDGVGRRLGGEQIRITQKRNRCGRKGVAAHRIARIGRRPDRRRDGIPAGRRLCNATNEPSTGDNRRRATRVG